MKELSIEEKAKRYDEALKVLHKYDGANIMFTQDLKEEMFPELKESEDEKIKKTIKQSLKSYFEGKLSIGTNDTDYAECLVWLEKQGEQKYTAEEVLIKAGLKPYKDADQWCILLGDNIQEGICGFGNTIEDALYAFLKDLIASQSEQKPADEVKPNFKVGDWMVYKENIYQIHNIGLKKYYDCLRTDGTVHTFDFEYIDSKSHLWTIQDAKDGDVLACENDIVIFKENSYYPKDKSGCMFVYCSCNNFYEIGGINPTDYKPATKEQRDLLFQKMREAGYEWDAEKKELKKVESRQEELTNFEKALKQVMEEAIECGDTHKLKGDADMLLRLAQKPWSEEDEDILNTIINHFKVDIECTDEDDMVRWLKSLRDRYTWKPSDEQMLAINTAINVLGKGTINGKYLIELLEQLKKLREDKL